jgi:hypothetical protein
MVIPTPSKPELHEMPRDFFKELAVFTTPKQRAFPQSKLLPVMGGFAGGFGAAGGVPGGLGGGGPGGLGPVAPPVRVLEVGLVGNLDYKIITADRSDALYTWLKDNKYSYAGDEATLEFYVKKKYVFTVMKIDTMQMKKDRRGFYTGDVTPTRFTFTSDKLIYPVRITQISVKDQTEALFYVQAPFKVDLPGDLSYQYTWVPTLQTAKLLAGPRQLPGKGDQWLTAIKDQAPALVKRGQELGFTPKFPPDPKAGPPKTTPTTLEWAKRLTATDLKLIAGQAAYSDKMPNPDEGFSRFDLRDPRRAAVVQRIIQQRLNAYTQKQPEGYLIRKATKTELDQLRLLSGHLKEGQFLTKFRKVFTKGEMNDDLVLVPAGLDKVQDESECEEVLAPAFGGAMGLPGGPPVGFPGIPPAPGGLPGAVR